VQDLALGHQLGQGADGVLDRGVRVDSVLVVELDAVGIGRDSSDPVSHEYTGGFDFTGGKIHEVEVNIGDDVYLDIERDFAAAMARD
jgi:hypothetical protein